MITENVVGRIAVSVVILVAHGVIAQAAPISPLPDTKPSTLQLADLSGIAEWRVGGAKFIYIKDDKGQWYQVDLREACMKFDASKGIRFITEIDDGSDRYSAVDVAYHQCRVTAITKIKAPPPQ